MAVQLSNDMEHPENGLQEKVLMYYCPVIIFEVFALVFPILLELYVIDNQNT